MTKTAKRRVAHIAIVALAVLTISCGVVWVLLAMIGVFA